MTAVADKQVDNGVNVEALLGAREALSQAPAAARFNWKATSKWVGGTHTRTHMKSFFGLGQDQSHKSEFTFDTDHPEIFASADNGATPVEMVLTGLAGCLTAGIAAVAQNRKIQLRSVKATLEGSMDIQGILGIDSDVRNGYRGAGRAVAEALGGLRHPHQPDRRLGQRQLAGPCAPTSSSSARATPASL